VVRFIITGIPKRLDLGLSSGEKQQHEQLVDLLGIIIYCNPVISETIYGKINNKLTVCLSLLQLMFW